MAKRYGILPTEILKRTNLFELQLNAAVMLKGMIGEAEAAARVRNNAE